jgi:phosphoesterase RecJ-like protein
VFKEVKDLLDKYHKITILTHLNPDADTIGTALGIYEILKRDGKQVEIVNGGKILPMYLDFLPHFSKIKNKIDFDGSLLIACDSGSIDRLGFNVSKHEVLNIDHHKSNSYYGTVNVVEPTFVSASEVAYKIFKEYYPINKNIATCFYTALLSDTQYFSTNNVSKEVFTIASELLGYGINLREVVSNLKQRRSLSSLRILSSTLDTLELSDDGELVIMFANREKMLQSGATLIDTVGIVDHAISLVTSKIAMVLIELEASIRVSMRSKSVDISDLAVAFGGGGHKNAVGFEIKNITKNELISMIKKEIKIRGLLDEK